MINKRLDEFEAKIDGLEELCENEDSDDEAIQTYYDELVKLYDDIKTFEIDAFPYGKYSEKVENNFHKARKRFEKLEKRLKEIQKEDRFEGWKDTSWMFVNDEDESDF